MIECKDTAYKRFIQHYKNLGYEATPTKNSNKDRHMIVELTKKDEMPERVYLIYKREWFNTFSKQFTLFIRDNPEFEGSKGDSINQDSLDYAISNFCDKIVFCHREGYFWVYSQFLKRYAIKHQLIRTQEKENVYRFEHGLKIAVKEATYSIPTKFLQKLEVAENDI